MPLVLVIVAVLVLLLVGGLIIGLTLKLLGYVITGVIVGALARLILPGRQSLGWLATILFGLGGALLGGIVANALDLGSILEFVLAVVIAAALIAAFAASRGRRALTS